MSKYLVKSGIFDVRYEVQDPILEMSTWAKFQHLADMVPFLGLILFANISLKIQCVPKSNVFLLSVYQGYKSMICML